MKFRPCIDIHNGSVKQIIGGSLTDSGNQAVDNFISGQNAAFYAKKYREDGLSGGHIILLNPKGTEFYEADVRQAKSALEEYPGGMQIGGGMDEGNAEKFLAMGASHIIVTSYVFRDGMIYMERLKRMASLLGKEHLVLDLSCRYAGDDYYIVTDRWQKVTKVKMNRQTLEMLAEFCDEFLIHAVDVEGKASGVEKEVVRRLGERRVLPVTYAGGIHSLEDIDWIREAGNGFIDFTVGSALDLFGGTLPYQELLQI
ncbi:MAG: phosphoribosylformimino-5-aminoimidazole carboxamide ribotide isomerase [Lachnospiraceae bacterium]|jgi:phosphoribosylformimino-5-aminoimidazole carboxamide ribotide isomerase, eukaryotic type|nr:phosphoribosylformimino-5-aminoimidazole carboxamide ribotide isomerase [Lachnospiraceae bacterium]